MNFEKLVSLRSWTGFPVGLSGCRTSDHSFSSCDYDITVFDNKSQNDEIIQFQNNYVHIHHGFISETNSKKLIHFDDMKIIQDESWELRMLIAKIKEKKQILYKDYAKNCLLDSLFCCEKAKQASKDSNVFASCWQKCATYFLAEGIVALNHFKPSPTHMLEMMREFDKNSINEKISTVNETVGIERAAPSLLERMLKSTIGFSDLFEKNNHSMIIGQQYDHFIKNSMFTDCYFYLGYINKEIFTTNKDSIQRQPDLIHILKVSFDLGVDINLVQNQANLIHKASNEIMEIISKR